jgi:CRP-like cAMP-binding protein
MIDLGLTSQFCAYKLLTQLVLTHGERTVYHRGEYMVKKDEYNDQLALIKRGAFKYTHQDYKGNERILSFAFENDLIGCYIPARIKQPAMFSVQALEASVVLQVSMSKVTDLFQQESEYHLSDTLAYAFLQKFVSAACDSPWQRYNTLIQKVPHILNRISQKDIASYIGVRPETLSRMRTDFVKLDNG